MLRPELPKRVRLQCFFDQAHYVVGPEGTVAVTVSLQETFNPSATSSLLAPGTDGLIQGGVLVEVGVPAPGYPARVRTPAAIIGNPGFDVAIVPVLPVPKTAHTAGILELSSKPVYGEIVSRSANCETVVLPLGTFVFTAGRVPGEVTFLTAMVTSNINDSTGDVNVTDSGISLDPLIQPGTAMITVAEKVSGPHLPKGLSGVADALGILNKDVGLRRPSAH
jgi:hypothetical protein